MLVECEPLTAPDNGMISCVGNMFGDTCTITCDAGYELSGNETRTCQSDQIWSGIDTTCAAGNFYTLKVQALIPKLSGC